MDALAPMQIDNSVTPDLAALSRIRLTYLWRHGRLPRLANPTRFTELVQLRKLYDRDPRLPVMADKVAIKELVAERLGREWVIPTLWSGATLPKHPSWDAPVVVKARHGCNQKIVVRPGQGDWADARARSITWLVNPYGRWLDEWLYAHIPRGVLIEPFVGVGGELPLDYKVFVFHGQATHVQVHTHRATNHRWTVYDLDWRPLSPAAPRIKPPSALSAMLRAAEEMAKGFSFARVDFYQPLDRPLFGEITFYPGSGLDPFEAPDLDEEMGALWLNRKVQRSKVSNAPEHMLVA